MNILVTGGAGYIGSHTCVELLGAGHDVVVADNFVNSCPEVISRIRHISGRNFPFYNVDLGDRKAMESLFTNERVDAVIHFAALKAPGESVGIPLRYYGNNIGGTVALCETMASHGVKKLVFSSSAAVYGNSGAVPLTEEAPLSAASPYGYTKLIGERILRDLAVSDPTWSIAILRYFNPIGAHKSGLIGECPRGLPNNLIPAAALVAAGRLKELKIFGDDYPTPDGTGVRDYIHVMDLAKGHISALEKLEHDTGVFTYNLGTGKGYSVLEVVRAMSEASGRPIPYRVVARRPGDIAVSYADPGKAERELHWRAGESLAAMCEDTWRWQIQNPEGYEAKT